MFKASCLLLLTLVLNAQLCSSAPIPAEVVQPSVVAEEPGPEEPAPVTKDHSHFIEEKESVQQKLNPVVAEEAAQSPEESPAEEDIPGSVKEPEQFFITDQVSDDIDEDVFQEHLALAPQESSDEDTVPAEAPLAESSPDETTEEVAPVVEDSASEAAIPVFPSSQASDDEAPEENAEEEAALEEPLLIVPDDNTEVKEKPLTLTKEEEKSVVLVPAELEIEEAGQEEPAAGGTTPEESIPEEPAVTDLVELAEQEPDQEETVSIIFSETKEEEALDEHAKDEEAVAPVLVKENGEVDPANEELLPRTLEEEESVVLFPVELEGEMEPAAEEIVPQESAPEDPAVIVPLGAAEEEPDLEEQVKEDSIPLVSPEAPGEENPEEYTEVEGAGVPVPVVPEDNDEQEPAINKDPLPSTPEEESVVLFPVELEGEVEPAAEEIVPQESAPENPAVVVTLDAAEEEPDLEEQVKEDSIPIVSPEAPGEENPEEYTEVEGAGVPVPVVPEEIDEQEPAINKDPLPSTPEEEESVVPFHIELEGQLEPAAEEIVPQESAPENPAVIVPLDPAEEEPDLEEQVKEDSTTIVSPEAPGEENPEEYTEVEVTGVPVPVVPEENDEQELAINKDPLPSPPEEEESVVLVHAELETEEESQEEPTAEEIAPEKPAVIVLVEPTSEEPVVEDPVLIIQLEDLEEEAPGENTQEVPSDPLQKEAALEEDTALQENEAGDSDAEILVTSETETTEKVLVPGEEATTEVLSASLEPVTARAPAVTDVGAEIAPAHVEGGNGTSMKIHSEDFKSANVMIEEEPLALFNRGAVLGAAFFTMMCFITFGFVWTTVSKKLR